jgi:hypothetical protein
VCGGRRQEETGGKRKENDRGRMDVTKKEKGAPQNQASRISVDEISENLYEWGHAR